MAYVSHVAAPTRYFDHVYDPLFEVSSTKDVWKANIQALQRSAPLQITPFYKTMFSDMPNRPNYQCWKRQNPLPHFAYPGAIAAKSAYMQKIEQRKQICVEGQCRCNFFHYPPDCVKNFNLRLRVPPECKCLETPRNKFETVGCQTVYRETSAQTSPYLPDYYIAKGEPETPEISRIANLITGNKPPGEFEAKIIARARRRRQWEKQLPQTNSLKEWDQRRTIIEAFEWEEFLAREEDIQEMQELRMEIVRKLMDRREAGIRASSAAKLQHASSRIEIERKYKLQKLNHKFSRQMRKLEMARRNVPRKYKADNIVQEHVNQASDLYAPQMRFGIHPKRLHFVPFKSSFQARLQDFEMRKIDPKKLTCLVRKYDRLAQPKGPVTEIEKGFKNDKHLTNLYQTLKTLRDSANSGKGLPKCLEKIHKEKVFAAETPVGPSEDLYESSETHCCVYLQKLIKGRAVQKVIYNGRDRCRGLIEEIQTTHMLSSVSAMYPGLSNDTIRGRLCVQSQQKRFSQKIEREQQAKEIFKEAEAGTIGVLLEFLEKELRRMHEQRKIHALCILAERERMKREAAEAGKRQTENHRRQETEEIYRQISNASHDTIGMYLENLLLEESDKIAEEQARKKIQAMARRIDQEVSKSIDNKCHAMDADDNEDVINDLVKNFMFPEVQKRIAHSKMEKTRQRHLLAAHEALYGEIEKIFYIPTPRASATEIASQILNNLLDKVLSTDSVLSKIGRHENVARHEALAAIRKVLRRIFPDRKWKTSAERIVSATVSGLLYDAVEENQSHYKEESLTSKKSWLQEVTNYISERLWKYALEEFEGSEISSDTTEQTREDLIEILEEQLSPIFVNYSVGEIENEEREDVGRSEVSKVADISDKMGDKAPKLNDQSQEDMENTIATERQTLLNVSKVPPATLLEEVGGSTISSVIPKTEQQTKTISDASSRKSSQN